MTTIPAQVETQVTLTVVDPASIFLAQDLAFEAVFPADTALDISPDAGVGAGTSGAPSFGGTPASMLINGAPAESVSIDAPAVVELTRVGGSERLTIATAILGDAAQAVIGPLGTMGLRVGGRLNLDQNTVAGEYRGLLVMTAQYN